MLCICQHWMDEHDEDARHPISAALAKVNGPWVISPCAVPGCWCAGAGFFQVARGSRHRPGHATHANPKPVATIRSGDRVLITYRGAGRIAPAVTLRDSLIAEVTDRRWSGEGDFWHVTTDLGLLPMLRGRSSLRVVSKS